MFENLSLPHILMVLVIVMLLFGAKRIPEIAGSMGKGIREFKKNIHDGVAEILQAPLVLSRLPCHGGASRVLAWTKSCARSPSGS